MFIYIIIELFVSNNFLIIIMYNESLQHRTKTHSAAANACSHMNNFKFIINNNNNQTI